MKTKAAEAIDKMGVEIDQNMVISDMPVGHKQFTEIARELSKDHLKLLILDEPTAVLTEKEAAALLDSIRGMARAASLLSSSPTGFRKSCCMRQGSHHAGRQGGEGYPGLRDQRG